MGIKLCYCSHDLCTLDFRNRRKFLNSSAQRKLYISVEIKFGRLIYKPNQAFEVRQWSKLRNTLHWFSPLLFGYKSVKGFVFVAVISLFCPRISIRYAIGETGRSQWPRSLSYEQSSPAQTLRSWVRIPFMSRMPVCIYSVFVLSSVQVAALRRADPPSKVSYRLRKRSRNWKKRDQGPTKSCKATDR
jgi:hypothetical protein